MSEVILILVLGYSPGNAPDVRMQVLEIRQPSLEVCERQAKALSDHKPESGIAWVHPFTFRIDAGAQCVLRSIAKTKP